jgi:hypothetical protein
MKNIISILVISFFAALFAENISAQTIDSTQTEPTAEATPKQQKHPVKKAKSIYDHMYFGGTIGATFGSYTMLSVYPMVAYKITPKLSLGIKAAYEYVIDKRYATDYKSSNYGLSVFSRYRLVPSLYFHIEYAQMNYELYDMYGQSDRVWVPFLFIGGGYSKSIGNRAWLNFQVLFDVLQNSRSPYSDWSPFISIGIGKGF